MKKIFTFAVIIYLAGLIMQGQLCAEETSYRIGPENLLQVDVHYGKDGVISQKVRVSSGGMINFPLVGEVKVADITTSELEKKLFDLLSKDYLVNPQVTVVIEEYSTVSIMGEVKKPGSYPIKGKLTVVELISLAEGFSKIASPNGAKVIRTNPDGSKTEIRVRISDIVNKGRQKSNIELQAGDVVIVPESLF